tara:strand:- start:1263 stop:1652 length:390 start_codon:yes stop_codon:yes gene_type:complete
LQHVSSFLAFAYIFFKHDFLSSFCFDFVLSMMIASTASANSFTIYSSPNIAGKQIVANLGMECQLMSFGDLSQFQQRLKNEMKAIAQSAMKRGANALVNARFSQEGNLVPGQNGAETVVMLCADAVKVR